MVAALFDNGGKGEKPVDRRLLKTAGPDGRRIYSYGEIPSAIDAAFALALEGRLNPFESVLAASQTAGRGQMRRGWISPPGNVYAALRLPPAPPFTESGCAVAVAFMLAEAMITLGYEIKIKWPNDLVLLDSGKICKVGGVLVEERDKIIIAGVGINLSYAPENKDLRPGRALPAGRLHRDGPAPSGDDGGSSGGNPAPEQLWDCLVRESCKWYDVGRQKIFRWVEPASEILLWRGCRILYREDDGDFEAVILGLAPSGGIRLLCPDGEREFTHGGILSPVKA